MAVAGGLLKACQLSIYAFRHMYCPSDCTLYDNMSDLYLFTNRGIGHKWCSSSKIVTIDCYHYTNIDYTEYKL